VSGRVRRAYHGDAVTSRARLPRLSIPQRAALRAVMETGTGAFENLSGWHRGKFHKGARMFFTSAGAFRWSTGEALVDAGLLTVEVIGTNKRARPTLIAHTVVAMLGDLS